MADMSDYFVSWTYPERYKIQFSLTEEAATAIHGDAVREAEMLSPSSWLVQSLEGSDPMILEIYFSAPRLLVLSVTNMNSGDPLAVTLFPGTDTEIDLGNMEFMGWGNDEGEYTVFPLSPALGETDINPLESITAYIARADLEIPDNLTVTTLINEVETETTIEIINPYLIKATASPSLRYDSHYVVSMVPGE